MSRKPRFPLLAKMVVWLLIHFVVLTGAFAIFVDWQLKLGLDSVLSGAAGDRLKTLGSAVASDLKVANRDEWPEIMEDHLGAYGLDAMLKLSPPENTVIGGELEIPKDIHERLNQGGGGGRGPTPPRERERFPEQDGRSRRGGPPPPDGMTGGEGDLGFGSLDRPPNGRPPGPGRSQDDGPEVRPLFLHRSDTGSYWAAIDLPLFEPEEESPLHGMLILRSNSASAGGLFFDFQPWLMGGLAVLFLSLLLWAPFIVGITRYVSRLSRATERIALGKFDTQINGSRRDELGSLGESIEEMAQQIDRLLRGQKRFLGDVAHELCSPLARIRTGLGVMEHGLSPAQKERLDSIDEDVGELSDLISEILAFTKASTAPNSVNLEPVDLLPLLKEELERECPGHEVEWRVADGTRVLADRRLLSRAVANVMRNAHRHAGAGCALAIYTKARRENVELMIADDGPGVGPGIVSRLFEPFYRPDEARNREAGGAGLGMAIVRTAAEACGGSVSARRVDPHGLAVILVLPAA
ncbi:sensor histidine kinase [Haloferula chungangensis]|uniref:histidine kinase n=1 Tax=Haloferula chungangensis TaxID=1048331 RepID=A0ABW2L727_9BACT